MAVVTAHASWRERYLARQELFRTQQLAALKTSIQSALIVTAAALFVMLVLSWSPAVLLFPAIGWLSPAVRAYRLRELRPEPVDQMRLLAAVKLPSGEVLVFDQHGHGVDELCGPYEPLKDEVVTELGLSGRFFTVDGSTTHYWEGGSADSGYSTPRLDVTLRVVETAAADWAAGARSGELVGQATWTPGATTWSPQREDIWLLIRDAALRPSPARSEPRSATRRRDSPPPSVFAADRDDHVEVAAVRLGNLWFS